MRGLQTHMLQGSMNSICREASLLPPIVMVSLPMVGTAPHGKMRSTLPQRPPQGLALTKIVVPARHTNAFISHENLIWDPKSVLEFWKCLFLDLLGTPVQWGWFQRRPSRFSPTASISVCRMALSRVYEFTSTSLKPWGLMV